MPQVMFVSVDPGRDSIKQIQRYIKNFNAHFSGATGSKKALKDLTKQFNVIFMKVKQGGKKYTIDHSTAVLIINPEGQFFGVFTQPQDLERLINELKFSLTM